MGSWRHTESDATARLSTLNYTLEWVTVWFVNYI